MSEEEDEKRILDLSKKSLKKVPKQDDAPNYTVLILDNNELQKIENFDCYSRLENLSIKKNQLLRMYGVCRLHCLRELNLSFNGILTIEGLKELIHLTHLNLEGNSIKTIEHLNTNIKLQYLNLGENSIGCISDISFLKNLKELNLCGNRLLHLKQCEKYLPMSLQKLSIAKNNIIDLNEISSLSHLCNLFTFDINGNPCVRMSGTEDGFDHRPFIINWILNVKVIDGYPVNPIESLKGEWLYSQGRGRQFQVGEQAALARYLSTYCPLIGKTMEDEKEKKLRLILRKAKQHERQLQEEITSENNNSSGGNSPSNRRKPPSSRIQSPRYSRLGGRQSSPESMSSSYHGITSTSSVLSNESHSYNSHNTQMSTSLIEGIRPELENNINSNNSAKFVNNISSPESSPRTKYQISYNGQINSNYAPLLAASKMVPVPETLMSPDSCPLTVNQRIPIPTLCKNLKTSVVKDLKVNSPKIVGRTPYVKKASERSPVPSPKKIQSSSIAVPVSKPSSHLENNLKSKSNKIQNQENLIAVSSDDDSEYVNLEKLKTIRSKVAQRNQEEKDTNDLSNMSVNSTNESSAVLIQKTWRGYNSRKKTQYIAEKILRKRTQDYIEKLSKDMELTKSQLENERRIQQLQMQAINALWKRISITQPNHLTEETNKESKTLATNCKNAKIVTLDKNSAVIVNDLAKTCSLLTNQIQQLQCSMRDILDCMSMFFNLPQENIKELIKSETKDNNTTQTEIIAVHTPQVENFENFPYKIRPSSLSLETNEKEVILLDSAQNNLNTNNFKEKQNVINVNTINEKVDTGQERSTEAKLSAENEVIKN